MCVRTLGANTEFCDDKAFVDYDPYEVELKSTNYPYKLLSGGEGDDLEHLSLVPREIMLAEKFAMWGELELPKKIAEVSTAARMSNLMLVHHGYPSSARYATKKQSFVAMMDIISEILYWVALP